VHTAKKESGRALGGGGGASLEGKPSGGDVVSEVRKGFRRSERKSEPSTRSPKRE